MARLNFSYLLDIQMKIAGSQLFVNLNLKGEITLDRNESHQCIDNI